MPVMGLIFRQMSVPWGFNPYVYGNTFRFRPDGYRVEQTTFGWINSFGSVFIEWGFRYSTGLMKQKGKLTKFIEI
jgi:hypothetical protein